MIGNEKVAKSSHIFCCNNCDYYTVKKCNYDKHILTSKHLKSMIVNENVANVAHAINETYMCSNCNKQYKDNSGLWRHKKKCSNSNNNNNDNDKTQELVQYLMKENSELKTMILDVCKNINISNQTNCNNINNSHNKTFNLQVFLNETCKDAMNIMDFVDSLKLQLSDLENLGKIGYVEGISSIIVKNLNSLDETMRPVHCTDSKREVMYVKDENKWEKENENNQKLRKAIKGVVRKNSKLLNDFRAKHPDCDKSDSRYSDQYNKLVVEIGRAHV